MKKLRITLIICVTGVILVIMTIGAICLLIEESNRSNYYEGMILDTGSENIVWSESVKTLATEIFEQQGKPLMIDLLDSAPKNRSKKVFNTWDDLIDFLGFTPWNPLEDENWVEKACYEGKNREPHGKTNQCLFECKVSDNGSISSAIIKTGYLFDETVDVVQTIYLGYHPTTHFDKYRTKQATIEIKTGGNDLEYRLESHLISKHDVAGYSLEIVICDDNNTLSSIKLTNKTNQEDVINAYSKLCKRLNIDEETSILFYDDFSLQTK